MEKPRRLAQPARPLGGASTVRLVLQRGRMAALASLLAACSTSAGSAHPTAETAALAGATTQEAESGSESGSGSGSGSGSEAGIGHLSRCFTESYAGTTFLEGSAEGSDFLLVPSGKRFVWDDGKAKTPDEQRDAPDIQDTIAAPYPAGVSPLQVAPTTDPGRVRHEPLLRALYGATRAEVAKQTEVVDWFGQKLRMSHRFGAAAALRKVATELAALPADAKQFYAPSPGTFNWRRIAGESHLSAHSFGIAIDLPVASSDYWRWTKEYRNRIPLEIVAAFERHGFVWGGKWLHFDTMHFEFRPELLHPACRAGGPTSAP